MCVCVHLCEELKLCGFVTDSSCYNLPAEEREAPKMQILSTNFDISDDFKEKLFKALAGQTSLFPLLLIIHVKY